MSGAYESAIAAEKRKLEAAIMQLKIDSFSACADIAEQHGNDHGRRNWQHTRLMAETVRDMQAA